MDFSHNLANIVKGERNIKLVLIFLSEPQPIFTCEASKFVKGERNIKLVLIFLSEPQPIFTCEAGKFVKGENVKSIFYNKRKF